MSKTTNAPVASDDRGARQTEQKSNVTNHTIVVEYLDAGFALVPIPTGRKGPVSEGWQLRENCITDAAQAQLANGGNIGIAHVHSRTCAIDIDAYDGAKAWLAKHDVNLDELLTADDAVQISSGREGHAKLLYSLHEHNRDFPQTFQIKSDAGVMLIEFRCSARGNSTVQDLLPPSIHPDTGRPYKWAGMGDWQKLPQLPDCLQKVWREQLALAKTQAPVATGGECAIQEGCRNAHLASLAGSMRRRGMSVEAMTAALLVENANRCDPPLGDDEARTIVRSVGRYEPAQTAQTSATGTAGNAQPMDREKSAKALRDGYHNPSEPDREQTPTAQEQAVAAQAVYRRMSDVVARPIHWLWPGRIARGKVSLIAGHPGLGKSQLSCSLAAIVTTGGLWPDRVPCEPGNVVILSAEDDAEDTIKPRLQAAGADVDRIYTLDAIREPMGDGKQALRGFNVLADLDHLGAMLRDIGGAALVIIDPISAYLGGIDSHKNSDVRMLLSLLKDLAEHTSAAVVGVSHLNKGGGDAMSRITGSLAFVAAARAAYLVARDKDDSSRRLFLPIKNNIGNDSDGLAFCIEGFSLPGDIETSRILWEPDAVSVTADEALSFDDTETDLTGEKKEAADFLKDELASGPVPVDKLKKSSSASGLSWRTIRRAKKALKIESRKRDFDGGWEWFFPQGGQGGPSPRTWPPSAPWESSTPNVPNVPKVPNISGTGDLGTLGESLPPSGRGNTPKTDTPGDTVEVEV